MTRRVRRPRSVWLGVMLVAVCAAGCGNPHPPGAAGEDPLAPEDYPQVAALEGLKRKIVVANVVEDPGPPMHVQVTLRNRSRSTERHVQYRFLFFDEQERPENPNPDWHYMHLPARTEVFMQANALDAKAGKWRLEIRPAR